MATIVPIKRQVLRNDDAIADVMALVAAGLRQEFEDKLAAMEARLNGVQAALQEFRFVGTWQEHKTYRAGNFCSMGGQLFHANTETTSRPGTDATWTLAVRSGRDGRDGRPLPEAPAGPRRPTAATRGRPSP